MREYVDQKRVLFAKSDRPDAAPPTGKLYEGNPQFYQLPRCSAPFWGVEFARGGIQLL